MLRGDYITGLLAPQIKQFDKMFTDKVFPLFADPEAQAEKVANEFWNEKMAEPVGEYGPDEDAGEIADDANAKGQQFYSTIAAMHHTVLNLFAAGVFHLFEQQAATLLEDWTGKRPRFPFDGLKDLVNSKRGPAIDVTAAPSWVRINELRLVANVVKHAEGNSANDLRALNPAYFRHPVMRENPALQQQIPDAERMFGAPLTGEGIYVTKDDYDAFVAAVVDFWDWLAGVVG